MKHLDKKKCYLLCDTIFSFQEVNTQSDLELVRSIFFKSGLLISVYSVI